LKESCSVQSRSSAVTKCLS